MSNKKKLFVMFVLIVSMLVTIAPTYPPPPDNPPGGCTPGYWKNHFPSAAQGVTVGDVFGNAPAVLAGDSLKAALSYHGGSGELGAARILLRAATASLFNSYYLSFPLSTSQVISATNAALASGSRSTMLSLASTLDNYNNIGCPLN